MQETNEVIVAKIKDGMDVSGNMLKLWQQNRGFIRMTARRYKDYENVEDLEQQGYIGLSNAVEGYRKDENVPFINYAALWIRQSMLRYIDENGSLVRIPSARRQEQRRYKNWCVNLRCIREGRRLIWKHAVAWASALKNLKISRKQMRRAGLTVLTGRSRAMMMRLQWAT